MSAILQRLKLILRSWLSALLASAEDPRQVFVVAHQRQKELLAKVQEARAKIAGSREQLEAKTQEARSRLPELDGRARQALRAGRENQARFALQLRQATEDKVRSLDEQLKELEQEEQVLSLVEHRLEAQIEAFFARQEVLAARYNTAEAQVRVHEALGGVSDELAGLGTALERAEQRTELMQARVAAIDELAELGVLQLPDTTVVEASQLQPPDSEASQAIEERLAGLKQELDLSE